MPEEVLFETESKQDRSDVATVLRDIADHLDDGGPISLTAGDQSISLELPNRPTFEIKVEREGPADADGELSLELELEWPEGGASDEPVQVS